MTVNRTLDINDFMIINDGLMFTMTFRVIINMMMMIVITPAATTTIILITVVSVITHGHTLTE